MLGDTPSNTPSGYQRTAGGNVRWQPPTPEDLQALLPQYTILSLVGHGGMGAVYKARQINLDREVAIKILPPDEADDVARFIDRFKSEARTMAKMNHPAIVHVYDFGEMLDGKLYFVMEFVDGTDVLEMIEEQGRLTPEHALAITAHVCDALQYAHTHGVIHRDIKPANVLINKEGSVKVADFGLAKMADPANSSGLTVSGMALGTPHFVAPEALLLGIEADHRADLYAVGVMLYQMLTGKIPRGMAQPPSALVKGLDHRFDAIVAKALQEDREHRQQSAIEIRHALDEILTVPLAQVNAAGESSAAIPKQSVAQKPTARGVQRPQAGAAAAPARSTKKSRARKISLLPIALGVLAVMGIAVFFFMGRTPADGVAKADTALQSSPAIAPVERPSAPASGAARPIATTPAPSLASAKPVVEAPKPAAAPTPPVALTVKNDVAPAADTPADAPKPSPTPAAPAESSPSPAAPSPSPVSSELDQRLAAIESAFHTAVERDADAAFKSSMSTLDKSYLGAIDRALASATQGGKLEEAVALREEKQRIEKGKGVPSELDESTQASKVPDALKALRKTYRSSAAQHEAARAKAMQPLYEKHDQALAAVQAELTKASKLDEALRVKAVREQVAAAKGGDGSALSTSGATSATQATAVAAVAPTGDWLSLARRRGGPLKLWGGQQAGQILEVPAKAARYDDYVSLNMYCMAQRTLFATRRDGSVVALEFIRFPKIEVLEHRNVSAVNAGEMQRFLGKDGNVRNSDGTEIFNPRAIKKPWGFTEGYRGGVVYSEDGRLEAFKVREIEAPPVDFLKGQRIVAAAGSDTLVFLTEEGKVIAWDGRAKQPLEFGRLKDNPVAEVVVGNGGFAFRTRDGQILLADTKGRFGNGGFAVTGNAALKGQSGPYVRVQGTVNFGAAQRHDGSWLAWGAAATVLAERAVRDGVAPWPLL